MPLLIPCANPTCPNVVDRLGDLCPECRKHSRCPYCKRPMVLQVTGATVIDLRDDYIAVPQKGQGKIPVQIADGVRYVAVAYRTAPQKQPATEAEAEPSA